MIDALQRKKGGNCLRSYRSLEKATDGWCSHTAIEKWLKSQPDFAIYSKKVRPGLTDINRKKQVEFARHIYILQLESSEKHKNTLDDVRREMVVSWVGTTHLCENVPCPRHRQRSLHLPSQEAHWYNPNPNP
jgi:hypothetical protein